MLHATAPAAAVLFASITSASATVPEPWSQSPSAAMVPSFWISWPKKAACANTILKPL